MMHPDTELRVISAAVGSGVFATAAIPRGTMTWVRDALDQRFVAGRRADLTALLDDDAVRRFLYRDRDDLLVLLWDHGRFVNHSCEPNTAGGLDNDLSVALRDIAPGDEITEDYGELSGFEPFECLCGSPSCRGRIQPLSPARLVARERDVRAALAAGRALSQPLGWLRSPSSDRGRVAARHAPMCDRPLARYSR